MHILTYIHTASFLWLPPAGVHIPSFANSIINLSTENSSMHKAGLTIPTSPVSTPNLEISDIIVNILF